MLTKAAFILLFALMHCSLHISMAQAGTTYFIRPDGGSPDDCTGLVNAPYPGSGSSQPCAWDHVFRALPPGETPRIDGGDTLIIGSGSYMMGYGAPGSEPCEPTAAYNCHAPPVPSGLNPSQPTRILGEGWDANCPQPPELWGTGRPWEVINLAGSSHVEIACLELTDHSGCVEFHSDDLACDRDTPPFGDWASVGIYAEDSANVHLKDLDIHGFASTGVKAGRLIDWTVENVRIAGNGSAGWDGDIDGADSNSGTLTFRNWVVEWNGCGETYPDEQPVGCWAQSAGGYGDGVGTGATGGDWIIEDSTFRYNTSDGLDLLYHSEGGTVTLNRVRAEGNAGNQIKVTGLTSLTNGVLIGNCAFFDGKPFTYHVDNCRALGNTLEVVFAGGEQVSITNSTISGQGDGLIGGVPREADSCNGLETITARHNVFQGGAEFLSGGEDVTFLFYQENCGDLQLDSDYNTISRAKDMVCGGDQTYVHSGIHDVCEAI
jgi:hypothetical protein